MIIKHRIHHRKHIWRMCNFARNLIQHQQNLHQQLYRKCQHIISGGGIITCIIIAMGYHNLWTLTYGMVSTVWYYFHVPCQHGILLHLFGIIVIGILTCIIMLLVSWYSSMMIGWYHCLLSWPRQIQRSIWESLPCNLGDCHFATFDRIKISKAIHRLNGHVPAES